MTSSSHWFKFVIATLLFHLGLNNRDVQIMMYAFRQLLYGKAVQSSKCGLHLGLISVIYPYTF